jgi:hypothetical protein
LRSTHRIKGILSIYKTLGRGKKSVPRLSVWNTPRSRFPET